MPQHPSRPRDMNQRAFQIVQETTGLASRPDPDEGKDPAASRRPPVTRAIISTIRRSIIVAGRTYAGPPTQTALSRFVPCATKLKRLTKYDFPPVDRPCHVTVDGSSTVGGTGHGRDVSRYTDSATGCGTAILARPSSRLTGARHVAATLRRSERPDVEFPVPSPSQAQAPGVAERIERPEPFRLPRQDPRGDGREAAHLLDADRGPQPDFGRVTTGASGDGPLRDPRLRSSTKCLFGRIAAFPACAHHH